MVRRLALIIIVTAVLFAGIVGGSLYLGATSWKSPAAVEVEIAPGSSVRKIADQLSAANVIRQPRLFEVAVRLTGAGTKMRAGLYAFPAGTTLLVAMRRIARGDVLQFPLTVIEGWTIRDIAAAMAGQRFLSSPTMPQEFVKLAMDPGTAQAMGFAGAKTLEGYLFPDTYHLSRPTTAEGLIRRMTTRFKEVWAGIGGAAAAATGLTDAQIVTLASIVEKETGAGGERPLVASVFFNRLRTRMPLQSDPTIIYGLPDFDGNIRKVDITNPHPYNTYVHAGLPPGPICNPGKASLQAVLHPSQSDFLFFVSKNNGTHQFSRTLDEHNAAVRQYQ